MKTKKTTQSVILAISIHAHANKRNELLSACRVITNQTLQEKGCMSYRISQDIDNENLIYLEETWKHRSHLDDHIHSDIFRALVGSVKFLGKNHEIRINDFSGTERLGVVRSAK